MGSHSKYMPERQRASSLDDSDVSSRDDIFDEKALLHSSSICNCHSESSHRHSYRALFGHLIFLCIYSFIALGLVQTYSNAQPPCQTVETLVSDTYEWVHSPAREAITYQRQLLEGNVNLEGPYTGNPGPEVDAAWRKLLSHSNIRVSTETLRKIDRTSIELADGSGDHWGSIAVYHHLHCLKTFRHYIARDYYGKEQFQNFTIGPGKFYPDHIEHCIEQLRTYLMCRPDLSITTYNWVDYLTEPEPDLDIMHDCVDWSRLDGWTGMQAFNVWDERGLLRRPNGTVWP